jgi:hypothetical protein
VPLDLGILYGAEYRVVLDESAEIPGQSMADRSWLRRIPGKKGHVYVHGEGILGAWTDRPSAIRQLGGIGGLKLHQRGDREATFIFSPAAFDAVAMVLGLKRRRRLSEERRRELIEAGAAHRFGDGANGPFPAPVSRPGEGAR